MKTHEVNTIFVPKSSEEEMMYRTDGPLKIMNGSSLPWGSLLRFLGQQIEIHNTILEKRVLQWNVYEVEGGPFDGEEVHTLVGSEGDAKVY